ncbi:hypothetical protein AVM02_09815 [Brucella anthropi]
MLNLGLEAAGGRRSQSAGSGSKRKRTRQILMRFVARWDFVAVKTTEKRSRTREENAGLRFLFRRKGEKPDLIRPLDKTWPRLDLSRRKI